MFNGISKYADQVDSTMIFIVGFGVLALLGVTIVMLFFVFKYSAKRHPFPKQTHGSTALELVWMIIPTFIVMAMFYYGFNDYRNMKEDHRQDHYVKVYAKQFAWDFNYANGFVDDTLRVPVNKATKFEITGRDVIHSFYIPSLRIKSDAVPGRKTFYTIIPQKVGKYDITCAEYCGVRHWNMYTQLIVMPENEFIAWLDAVKPEAKAPDMPNVSTDTVSYEPQKAGL